MNPWSKQSSFHWSNQRCLFLCVSSGGAGYVTRQMCCQLQSPGGFSPVWGQIVVTETQVTSARTVARRLTLDSGVSLNFSMKLCCFTHWSSQFRVCLLGRSNLRLLRSFHRTKSVPVNSTWTQRTQISIFLRECFLTYFSIQQHKCYTKTKKTV